MLRFVPVKYTDPTGHTAQYFIEGGGFCHDSICSRLERERLWIDGYGYFDMGHIRRGFNSALSLIDQIREAMVNGGGPVVLNSYEYIKEYWVSGDITEDQIIGIALGIYMDFETGYETYQGTQSIIPWKGKALSSFTTEDLPSDYFGFC